jgi:hypothetical protein
MRSSRSVQAVRLQAFSEFLDGLAAEAFGKLPHVVIEMQAL